MKELVVKHPEFLKDLEYVETVIHFFLLDNPNIKGDEALEDALKILLDDRADLLSKIYDIPIHSITK